MERSFTKSLEGSGLRFRKFGKKGKGRKGKERKGKERKGKERKGKERKGKERNGKEMILIDFIRPGHGID